MIALYTQPDLLYPPRQDITEMKVNSLKNIIHARQLLRICTLHVQRERGKVIGVGVHIYIIIYIYIYICLWTKKKKLNRTLAIDSPFQTFVVGLLIKFID